MGAETKATDVVFRKRMSKGGRVSIWGKTCRRP
ncbi:hypothetical protein LINPERPRIM_LOCUS14497 [Linum perenne]